MSSVIGLVGGHLIQAGVGLAALLAAIARWLRRSSSAERSGPLRWAATHYDREYQHAQTVAKLLRSQGQVADLTDDVASLGAQIDGMDQRISDLLAICFDGSSRTSVDAERQRRAGLTSSPRRRRPKPRATKRDSISSSGG